MPKCTHRIHRLHNHCCPHPLLLNPHLPHNHHHTYSRLVDRSDEVYGT